MLRGPQLGFHLEDNGEPLAVSGPEVEPRASWSLWWVE